MTETANTPPRENTNTSPFDNRNELVEQQKELLVAASFRKLNEEERRCLRELNQLLDSRD